MAESFPKLIDLMFFHVSRLNQQKPAVPMTAFPGLRDNFPQKLAITLTPNAPNTKRAVLLNPLKYILNNCIFPKGVEVVG